MRVTEYGNHAHIWLAAAGDGLSDTFAVCGAEGRAIWYGPYLDADVDHPRGDRQAAAMGAAGRAIWLAGRATTSSPSSSQARRRRPRALGSSSRH
ncbi:hypothetical protein [Gordonia aichiensis]